MVQANQIRLSEASLEKDPIALLQQIRGAEELVLPHGWQKAPGFWISVITLGEKANPDLVLLVDTSDGPKPFHFNQEGASAAMEAVSLVRGKRNKFYGHPYNDFSKLAKMWSGFLLEKLRPDVELDCFDIAHMMIMLKINRNSNAFKWDNVVDMAGYAETMALIIEKMPQFAPKVVADGQTDDI